MIKVLVIEPKKKPVVREIEGGLDCLQGIVGGYIQVVYPFADPVGIICNEEGKMMGLPLNRALYHKGEIYDILSGTIIVAGLTEDDFGSLSDDLIDKYMKGFYCGEEFMKVNGQIVAIPMMEHVEELFSKMEGKNEAHKYNRVLWK